MSANVSAGVPAATGGGHGFNGRIMVGLVAAGLVGFIGFWLLTAFAPDLDATGNGGNHAMSRSAVGFSGLVSLARSAGMNPQILRSTQSNGALTGTDHVGLLVLTPTEETPPEDIVKRIGDFAGAVLVVLPKYSAVRDPLHRGWVRRGGQTLETTSILPLQHWRIKRQPRIVSSSIPAGTPIDVDIYGNHIGTTNAPEGVRLLHADGLYPVSMVGNSLLLAGPEDEDFSNIVILADPDFLNNRAMRTARGATAALHILRALNDGNADNRQVAFDVTLNGFGAADRTLLKLAVTPPFLGLTLCFVAAGLLALWQGFVRFGPPWREGRAVALGKGALVANGAQLIVQARRLASIAPRYSATVRDVAARRLHAPSALIGDALDRWLDRFVDSKGQRFSQLAGALDAATAPDDIVRRAAALGHWRREIVRDGE